MFPIRCLVECVDEGDCVKCSERGTTIADSFAIVAGQTPLSQLVETVLAALGLQHLAGGAKGWIQVKNWKPLSFEQITDDPDLEIDYVLKDVSNQLTLRILTKQADAAVSDCLRDMKDRLLKVALQKIPRLLQEAAAFQPQMKDLIIQLVQGDPIPPLIDAQQIHQFNLWLEEFASTPNNSSNRPTNSNGSSTTMQSTSTSNSQHRNGPSSSSNNHHHFTNHHSSSTTGSGNGVNNLTPGATRFSPLLEVPKLERWFKENPNPSRPKLQYYMQILNGSNFRKHAGKITYQQICNWFSNARASQRRKDGQSDQQQPSDQQQSLDGRPNSGDSTTPQNHWVNKVFSNNVRNLSIAFNDFIQSTPPPKLIKGGNLLNEGAVVALNVPNCHQSPSTPNQSNNLILMTSPSLETSSTSSQSPPGSKEISINVIRDDGVRMAFKEEEEEDNDSRMRIVLDQTNDEESNYGLGGTLSSSVSPVSMNAVLKQAITEGLPTMATPTRSSSAAAAAAAAAAYGNQSGANRTRLMFDPLTELPMLERWFEENPHPSWAQVDQYTDQLNSLSYRQTYPPVSSHNLKIWFKNRRAKCKRLMTGNGGDITMTSTRGE